MACCVLGALIISQILAIWRDRRRIALYAASLLVSVALLGWQIDAHAHHIQQFLADAKAFTRSEDPAVVALTASGVDCPQTPADIAATQSFDDRLDPIVAQ